MRYAVVLLAVLAPSLASAYSYVMLDDAQLRVGAEGVATLSVLGTLPRSGDEPATRYRVALRRNLAGAPLAAIETLLLPGVIAGGDDDLVVPGVPRLAPGAELLLFHQRGADGALQPSQLALGLFVKTRSSTGELLYLRLLPPGSAFRETEASAAWAAPRSAAAFERWLAAGAATLGDSIDYLRPDAVAALPRVDMAPPAAAAATVAPLLDWRPHAALAGRVDEPLGAVLDAALQALRSDALADHAASEIATQLEFDDVRSLIGGRYTKAGTLAIAGFHAGRGGRGAAALVAVQDGADTFLADAQAAEWLAHELLQASTLAQYCVAEHAACVAAAMPLLGAPQFGLVARPAQRATPLSAASKGLVPPTAPLNLRGAMDGTTAFLDWDTPVGGGAVSFYRVESCEGAGCTNFLPNIANIGIPRFDYSGLTPSTLHRFRVRAYDFRGFPEGQSEPSNVLELTSGTPLATVALSKGVPVSGLAGPARSSRRFTLVVPAGATNLEFELAGGSGDADMYVRFGSEPSEGSFDCRPYEGGNDELCTFAAPTAGTWHVLLIAASTYSGATLTARYTGGGDPGPGPGPGPGPATCDAPCMFRNGFED